MSVFMLFVSLCFSVSQYSNVSINVIRIAVFQCVPVQLCQYLCYLYLYVSVCPSTVMSVFMLFCISVFQCIPVQLCQYLCYLYLCVSVCPSRVMSVFMLFVSLCFSVSQYSNVSIYAICISVFQCVPVQ